MAPKIDPTKIHLGGLLPQYYAENALIAPVDEPISCELPPAVPVDLHSRPLLPLNFSCEFQFPPIVPIPPVYVPPVPPPPPFYPSCSTLEATTDITTCPSTRNSFLTLSTAGPESNTEGKPSACQLTLSGSLCVEACETFSAESAITFSGAARPSTLTVSSSSSPECGLTLLGNIDVIACEDFSAETNISFTGAARGSSLTSVSASAPNCGVSLVGSVHVNACESFTAISDIQLLGNISGEILTVPTSTPDCGVLISGALYVPPACEKINVSSDVSFAGAAKGRATKKYVKIGSTIPVEGAQGIDLYNESGTLIRPKKTRPAPPPTGVDPNIRNLFKKYTAEELADLADPKEYTLEQLLERKDAQKPPPGYSNVQQAVVEGSSLRLVALDDCSLSLQGEIITQACEDFSSSGTITISSKKAVSPVKIQKPITITAEGQPNCGIQIDGDIEIDACKEILLESSTEGGDINIYNLGVRAGKIALNPTLELTKKPDGCGYSLKLSLNDVFIDVGTGNSGLGPGSGGGGGGGGGSGGGGGCCDCYHCDPKQGCIRSLNVETLEVTSIFSTRYPCCDSDCFYAIDLCNGNAELKNISADNYSPSTCCTEYSDSSLNLCNGQFRLSTDPDNYVFMTPLSFEYVSGQSSTSIAGATITVDSGDSGENTIISSGSITSKDAGDGETDITPGYIILKGSEGSEACGRTELIPGGVTFIGTADDGGANDYTKICKSDVYLVGGDGSIRLYGGAITCANGSEGDTGLDNTYIDKGKITVRGMDDTYTETTGATLEQSVTGQDRLRTYIYPGTIESDGASGNFAVDDGALTLSSTSGASVKIDPNGLPSSAYVYFQQIDVCVDGKTKKAWVLMSDPEDATT